MRRTLVTLCSVVTLAGAGAAVGTATASAQGFPTHFGAELTGAAQAPPVDTPAHGMTMMWVDGDGSTVHFRLGAQRLSSPVTGVHIHLGQTGENGPVVVDLGHLAAANGSTENGGYGIAGSFTAADLAGPLKGHPLSELLTDVQNGDTYVNVHTTMHRDGEIRGDLRRSFF